jgi:cold shock protein
MATGIVKFFNVQKGFGFIQATDGSRDVFIHVSAVDHACMRALAEGHKISYDVSPSPAMRPLRIISRA